MIKVSVIVPVFNTEKFIDKCLTSLINQTLCDIEIICVNDGSTDNSPAILEKYVQIDSRIKVLSQENKKQGAARNAGLKIAEGEYIGFVDSDDWVDLDYYEKLYNTAKKYDADIALATNVRIGNGKTKKRLEITEEKVATSLQEKIDIGNQAKNPCPTNKIYRHTMLKNNNITWPEGVYCEDKLFTIKAVYYANKIVTTPGVNYYYFRNPDSTVNTKSKKHTLDKNKAKKDVIEFSLKEGTGQKYYTPAATVIFVNKHKVMDGYVDEFLALEEDALDGDFGKKAIVEFYECVNRKPFHKKELTKQELNLIEPDILKIQKLSPENPEILNKIKDKTDVIKNKLCKNIIKELKMVKKQIFNQPKDI